MATKEEKDPLNGDDEEETQNHIDDKDKPVTCFRRIINCGVSCVKGCMICCLPCINYCCCDTQKCFAAMEQCTCRCIITSCVSSCAAPFIECADLIVLPEFENPFKKKDYEDWGDGGSYDPRMIFWDRDGNLRLGSSIRNRDNEVLKILMEDGNDLSDQPADTIWMVIPSRWARKWVLFAHLRLTNEEPGPVDMFSLQVRDKDEELGWRPKLNLKPPISNSTDPAVDNFPGHYRLVTLRCYQKIEKLYRVHGHPMAVWGEPFHDVQRWRIFENTREVRLGGRDHLPIPDLVVKQREEEAKKAEAEAAKLAKAEKAQAREENKAQARQSYFAFFG